MHRMMSLLLVLAAGLLLTRAGLDQATAQTPAAPHEQENKALILRYYQEVSKGNLAIIDQLCAPNYVVHVPGPKGILLERRGTADESGSEAGHRHFMADVHYTVEDQIAEGDKVVTRWTLHGTTRAVVTGVPADTKVDVAGIEIDRIVGGKIVERWLEADALGFRQQLGIPLTVIRH